MQRTYARSWKDYKLLDAGNEKKLERWGDIVTIRPDRNAYFSPFLPYNNWQEQAHYEFIEKSKNSGNWKELKSGYDKNWQICFNNIKINLQLTRFKHLGIFPEQRANWDIISERTEKGDKFLNLFAYTGVASLIARSKGAEVYHCDSVKQVITWANENMIASDLSDIHWVLEDALKFAQRLVKRGHNFKGIIMDPPAFGVGANKERWKIENKFSELLQAALKSRTTGGYIIVNTYSPRLDAAKINRVANDLCSSENIKVSTLSIKSKTDKILDYGLRTLITD